MLDAKTVRLGLLGAVLAVGSAQASPQADSQFRAGVDLLEIDVQVTPAADVPLRTLTTEDFVVSISGHQRPVASATFLHYDTGKVLRKAPPQTAPDVCVFSFFRRTDRVTAHYLVAVNRTGADRREVTQVRVKLTDGALTAQQYVWRSPIHVGG